MRKHIKMMYMPGWRRPYEVGDGDIVAAVERELVPKLYLEQAG